MHNLAADKPFSPIQLPDGTKIDAPHPEWAAHRLKWRWMLDSYEGGDAYRNGVYGYDASTYAERRNLVRHKREGEVRGDDGELIAADDYEVRLARTPVPTFVQEAVDKHLGKIYNQKITREAGAAFKAIDDWWKDVDGAGTTADQWWADVVAPLLMVLGQIDLLFERPQIPEGEEARTRADDLRLGLDRVVASYILPENMVWWKLDRRNRYAECLVREAGAGEKGDDTFVYWTASYWARYAANGKQLEGKRGGGEVEGKHDYGRVPIFRAGDSLKRPRCRNVWMPRYEAIAELQREYYNRDSELILIDTYQAFPLLQGPEDYVKTGQAIPVGPNRVVPKKKNTQGSSVTYEGWDAVPFPNAGAETIRKNKQDIRDAADRAACLAKPAGAAEGDVTGQSGISKRIDQTEGNELLGEEAGVLQRAEETAVEYAWAVDSGGKPLPEGAVKVEYPRKFDLFSTAEFMGFVEQWQGSLAVAGALPEVEGPMLMEALRKGMAGRDDAEYRAWEKALDAFLKARAGQMQDEAEQAKADQAEQARRIAEALHNATNSDESPGAADVPPDAESDGDEI